MEDVESNQESAHHDKDIFVGNLSLFTTNEKLKEYLDEFGKVVDVRIMFHPETNRSRRFGFVTFERAEDADAVLRNKTLTLDGRTLDVRVAHKRSVEDNSDLKTPSHLKKTQPVKIFIGGISQQTKSDDVTKYFSKFGKLKDCCLVPDVSSGRHRGFAFVQFEDPQAAEQVCSKRYHEMNGKKVEVKLATPRNPPIVAANKSQIALSDVQVSASLLSSQVPCQLWNTVSASPFPSLIGGGDLAKGLVTSSQQGFQYLPPYQSSHVSKVGAAVQMSAVRYSPYNLTSVAPLAPPSVTNLPSQQFCYPAFMDATSYSFPSLMWPVPPYPPTGFNLNSADPFVFPLLDTRK